MSRYIFPPELMAKFYDGNATAEETMMILHAAENDPKLKEEIEFMYSFPEHLMKAHITIIMYLYLCNTLKHILRWIFQTKNLFCVN